MEGHTIDSSSPVRVIENILEFNAHNGIVSVDGNFTTEKVESKIFNFIFSALLLEVIILFFLSNPY